MDSRALSMDNASIKRGWQCSRDKSLHSSTPNLLTDMPPTNSDSRPLPTPPDIPVTQRRSVCLHIQERTINSLEGRIARLERRLRELEDRNSSCEVVGLAAEEDNRCRTQKPEDFSKCGHGSPLSCGRVSLDPVHDQWSPPPGTKEWFCITCDYNDTNNTPASSTSDNASLVRARGVAKQNKRARSVMSVT